MADEFSVVTWNLNSLRARIEHLTRWLTDHRPQVMCLQETKLTDDIFPVDALRELGYHAAFAGQKTYNGVAILATQPIEEVSIGFQGDNSEEQKRLISATVGGIRIVNAYVPQGSEVDSPKFAYKLKFLAELAEYFEANHRPTDPLVIVGDINVAPHPEDVFSAEEMDGQVCFHPAEREALERIREWGFFDLFRKFQSEPGFYSWWDYRQAAFRRNRGLRIDHIWATGPVADRSTSCWIDREERTRERASDHSPVVATLAGSVD